MTVIESHHAGGCGPPLVLLHGLTASWRIWQPVLGALAERHAVFAPSLAGHNGGPSLEPPDGGVPVMADALERTLDAAGIERAHVVGNSLGGWMALELARRGRAQSAVLLSPAGSWRSARDLRRVVRRFELADRLLEPRRDLIVGLLRRPGLRRLLLRDVMEHAERVPLGAAVEIIDDFASAKVVAGFMQWVRRSEPVSAAGLPDIPIRIAWAQHDRTIPFEAYGQPLVDALPAAEHVTLAGCGHVPMYDDPELVVRTILEVTDR